MDDPDFEALLPPKAYPYIPYRLTAVFHGAAGTDPVVRQVMELRQKGDTTKLRTAEGKILTVPMRYEQVLDAAQANGKTIEFPALRIGEAAPNGSIYADRSAHSGKPLFTTAEDVPFNSLLGMNDTCLDLRHRGAIGALHKLNHRISPWICDSKGWRLPEPEELTGNLFKHAGKGRLRGTFNMETPYWIASSTHGRRRHISTGEEHVDYFDYIDARLRPVR